MASIDTDVVIVGGGLAGLTLALQLRKERNDIDITVIERKQHPLPAAISKIGESTVEIGAHYLASVIGQRQHLESDQLPKFGLRLFFGDAKHDFSCADELGSSRLLSVPTYQLDRGLLENWLAYTAQEQGVKFFDNARVRSVIPESKNHSVKFLNEEVEYKLHARWLIDAAGRTNFLKRRFSLGCENNHHCNAIWFRVDGCIRIDEWTTSSTWSARCVDFTGKRWLSTNHLMGPGYWVWLIPLASGATSVGIVFDSNLHSLNSMRTFKLALNWLEENQPLCAGAIRDCDILDFHILRDYSHDCRQVFSAQQWALSGDSGVFVDPFYSPGTDFIGISNTFITDLIIRDLAGETIESRSVRYQQMYTSFYRNALSLYENLYPGFGDRHLMMGKTLWDYAFYWGALSVLFFQKSLTDLKGMDACAIHLGRIQRCNERMQALFRHHAREQRYLEPKGIFIDQYQIPILRRFNSDLPESVKNGSISGHIKRNADCLSEVARHLENLLFVDPQGKASPREIELLGDFRARLNV
jgi:flavin-dependent dehydrogenase